EAARACGKKKGSPDGRPPLAFPNESENLFFEAAPCAPFEIKATSTRKLIFSQVGRGDDSVSAMETIERFAGALVWRQRKRRPAFARRLDLV
ncbi:MAG: hypothetical protein LCH39_06715, partial [Proteobacteria bacterium]|nr:hypothetical protein [Pseudomonadota bacterium]